MCQIHSIVQHVRKERLFRVALEGVHVTVYCPRAQLLSLHTTEGHITGPLEKLEAVLGRMARVGEKLAHSGWESGRWRETPIKRRSPANRNWAEWTEVVC